MASFTDSPNLPISQYTPQYDVDLYGKLLINKQDQYNQGVARVQGAIDNVAGLEVARPVDKEYLNTKFNQLTSDIQSKSGADFSDMSVVGQSLAAASSLAKDSRIQNALVSTQKIKQLQASQNELRSKTPEKYGPQAEYYDNQFIDNYINSTDIDKDGKYQPKVYNGPSSATAYENYEGELRTVLKDLSPEISYKINAQGQFEYVYDKTSSLSPAKISQTVSDFFAANPRYQQSMQMDAIYRYKDLSPQQLNVEINKYVSEATSQFDSQIESLKNAIALNPNNSELVDKYTTAIADNEALKLKTASSLMTSMSNPNNIDQTKFNLFSAKINNLAVDTYQKSNTEEELKATPLAGRYVEFMKAGLDPQTGKPLKPGDALYATSMMTRKRSKADSEGGAGTGEEPYKITIGAPMTDDYTWDFNQSQIQTLASQEQDYRKNLKETMGAVISSDKQLDGFIAEQQKNLDEGKPVDPNFLEYQNATLKLRVQRGALEQLSTTIAEKAAKENPLPDSTITIQGMNVKTGDNSVARNVTLNPQKNAAFYAKLKQLDNELQGTDSGPIGGSAADRVGSAEIYANRRKARENAIDKYSGDRDYELLKAFGNNDEKRKEAIKPFDDVLSARIKQQENEIKQTGKRFAPTMEIFEGKKEQKDAVTRLLLQQINENTAGKSKLEDKDVEIQGFYEVGNQQRIRYIDKNDNNKVKEVPYTGPNQLVKDTDPYEWLSGVIQQTGTTPTKGDGVLHTGDGKIRYSISLNKLTGAYDANILNGGHPMKISPKEDPSNPLSPIRKFASPGEIVTIMDQLSGQLNPYTKQPYTRDEIVFSLTNTPQAFEQYMKNKSTR